MKRIINTVSFLTIMAVIPAAIAATSRVSYNATKSPNRLSVSTGISGRYTGAVSATQTNSTASLLEDYECVENYSTCLKDSNVCGADMEDCTTNVLFHAKMPSCLSVLAQCKTSGINSLFGTSDITLLSTVKEYDSTYKDEVKRYTYPTEGSVLGQMIIGAEISNRLTTEQCVRKYTNCLKKDTVCGDQFELCTDDKEFKKQALFCDSTLARCQGEGKKQLFGSATNAKNLKPSATSRIGTAIKDGAEMAAANAVLTCQKVADACFTNACSANPWRCIEDTNLAQVTAANLVAGGETAMTVDLTGQGGDDVRNSSLYKLTGIEVRKYFKSMCLETIGSNKYCYMTFEEKTPRDKDLVDVDNQEDVFSLAYAARKETINTKLQDIAKVFDKNAKDKCVETIKSCAMRSCGGGLGSVCYKEVFGSGGKTINTGIPYEDIQLGCSAVVNTDPNCQYAATASGDGYSYNYVNKDTFTTLFPESSTTTGTSANDDPIGVIATLNALLATSYNDAAIANMKKQCRTVAESCARSLCGEDFINCYRHRTDVIVDGTYKTGDKGKSFDNSMNKVGGVLDYNIVIGLCMNTVKNANVCDEHLRIAASDVRRRSEADTASWKGSSTVGDAWLKANSTKINSVTTEEDKEVIIACGLSDNTKVDGCAQEHEPASDGSCVGVSETNGCMYDKPIYQAYSEYVLTNSAKTLFQEVLRDIENEAMQLYNSKLTKEHNICYSNNNGGLTGRNDNGSTFMWVKLNSRRAPKNYETKGLQTKDFTASNDLYGSFCRARVSVKSDNKDIQEVLAESGDLNAYFAVGDAFTCGSWISSDTLKSITNKVGERALVDQGVMVDDGGKLKNSAKTKAILAWAPVASMVGGGLLGYGVTASIQSKGNTLGGLLKNNTAKKESEAKSALAVKCNDEIAEANRMMALTTGASASDQAAYVAKANSYAYSALSYAKRIESYGSNSSNTSALSAVSFKSLTYTAGTDDTQDEFKIKSDTKGVEILIRDLRKCCEGSDNKTDCIGYVNDAEKDFKSPNVSSAGNVIAALRRAQKLQKSDCVYYVAEDRLPDEKTFEVERVSSYAKGTKATTDIDTVKNSFETNIALIRNVCADDGKYEKNGLSEAAINGIGTGIGAVVGGLLGGGISATVIDVKKEEIKNEAVKQWMSEIGDHIECYVGADPVGSYGDTVSLEID